MTTQIEYLIAHTNKRFTDKHLTDVYGYIGWVLCVFEVLSDWDEFKFRYTFQRPKDVGKA